LNMGEPRSIFGMAEQVAELMNVPFRYEVIGLREGEKLHESLSVVPWKPTTNPMIYSVDDPVWDTWEAEQALRSLMTAANTGDPEQMFQCLESLGIQYRRTRNFDRNAIVGVFPDRSGPFDDCFTPG
jgi:FlaA1/EpsC-like NDP-sugar epimerase